MSDNQNLRDALRQVARAVRTAPERQKDAAVFAAFDAAGGVKPEALQRSLPPLMLTWWLPGAVSAGSNAGKEVYVTGAIRLQDISVRAKTAPVGSECKVRLTANGSEVESVGIQPGQTFGRSTIASASAERAAGETLRVDVVTASGAADVTVTLRYSLTGTSHSGGSSSGGTSGGGGVMPDLSGYALTTHNHDGTYSPVTHTHSVSDLTATGTRNSTTILYGDNTWKAAPSGGGVTDHTALTNIGTNTHAQIDTHIASTSNPHSVTKAQVGLSNVDNTSDANKPISTATQTALDAKSRRIPKSVVAAINGGAAITSAGTYTAPTPATFSGLTPGATYTVVWNVSLLAHGNSTTGGGFIGAQIVHNGGTANVDHGAVTHFPTTRSFQGLSRQDDYVANGSGVITVNPYFRWNNGSVTVLGAYLTASVE